MLPHRETKSKKPGEQKEYENSYQEMNLWYLSSVTRTKCEILLTFSFCLFILCSPDVLKNPFK